MAIVLGGGIAGLSAAHYLSKTGVAIPAVYEASSRFGGWIKTKSCRDGFFFESGPRTIRPVGSKAKITLELIEELDLCRCVIPIKSTHPAAKNRLIYTCKKLCPLPSTFRDLFKKSPPFSKPLISAIFHDIKTGRSRTPLCDESIYDFAERRFGTEVAKYAVSSMICGICAGDAREISVKLLMEDLFKEEQKHGGVTKAMMMNMFKGKKKKKRSKDDSALLQHSIVDKWKMYSLKGGMEMLPKTLLQKLRCDNINLAIRSECQRIMFDQDQVRVLINGNECETDAVISAVPAYSLASLVRHQHPILACELNQIPYVDVAVVNLQYKGSDVLKQKAFGVLVPPSENMPILGIIFDSCIFDMKGNTVITAMMGGRWFTERIGVNPNDKELLSIAKQYVNCILGINECPENYQVKVLRKCIPQYLVGHSQRVQRIRNYICANNLPLFLCGSAYDGVGINDVIYSAKKASDDAAQYFR